MHNTKRAITNALKNYRILRFIYNAFGNTIFRIVGLFIKTDPNLILFNCFGGKKYDDSPKALYEYIINDKRFAEYSFVWAFHEPDKFKIPKGKIIKTDTWSYFITALRAGIWITNSSVERGLSFKKRNTLYINTWHGTPLKLMGEDIPGVKRIKYKHDLQCAQSEYEAKVFSKAFNIPYSNFLIEGLPRNDELIHNDLQTQKRLKEKLGIDPSKKVILYAPTYRENKKEEHFNNIAKPPIDFDKWLKSLGNEYLVLLRLHYEVSKWFTNKFDNSFVIDVSSYPSLNELMLASDLLVTDYSSIMFDYSILERPIYIFAYDYSEYSSARGMYFDVREVFEGGEVSEEEIVDLIKERDVFNNLAMVRRFRDKYVTSFGNATSKTVDKIWELSQNRKSYYKKEKNMNNCFLHQ